MTKRLGVQAVLLAAVLLMTAGAQAQSRSILLLIADDIGIDATVFYPTSVRRVTTPPAPPMPNLERLAQNGILFRDAWANPFCSPTRATILTGRYGFRTGVGTWLRTAGPSLAELPVEEFVLPEAFTARPELGYVLAHIGKWHLNWGADLPNRHGWPYHAGPEPQRGGLPNYFSWTKLVNGTSSISETYATTDQVNEALGVIRRAKDQGKPYLLEVAFNAAHTTYHKPPDELHSKDALPPYTSGMSQRPYYEAMIEAMDTEVGRLLKEVDLATTTVIYLSDNGTPGEVIAPPYPRHKAKGTVYQGGVRVPLLIAGAGVASPGRMVERLVNTVDLFPTILELAGIDPSAVVPSGAKIDGVSLIPYIRNEIGASSRQWAYAEKFQTNYNDRYCRAIRDTRYKLIECAGGSREFYDLLTDPLEMTNLLGRTLADAETTSLYTLGQQLEALLATR